jgi:hypothetical protein
MIVFPSLKTQDLLYALLVDMLACPGKFSFIDLAGSERASDVSGNDKQTRYVPIRPRWA